MSDLYPNNKSAQVGLAITFGFLAIGDLIGNTLVIIIIAWHKSMRTPMNYLLINLALSDMMVAVFIMPRFILYHLFDHPDGVTGNMVCKFLTGGNLMWTGGAASVFSLLAVSYERYYAIIHPYSCHKSKISMKKVKKVVLACWFSACILNIPLFLTIEYDKDYNFCMEKWPQAWMAKLYSCIWFIVAGLLPVTTMVVLYSRVINTLWFKQRSQEIEASQLAVVKSRKRVTKMVVIVSILYVLSWLPYLTVYAYDHFHSEYKYGTVTYISTIVLVTCNSAINPFVYTFQNEKFKKHMYDIVCSRKWPCNRNQVEPTSSNSNSVDNNNTLKNTIENVASNQQQLSQQCQQQKQRRNTKT